MNRLGRHIMECRKGIGISQLELAKQLKKHPTYISKIEKGLYVPPIRTLTQVAKKLNRPIQEFTALIPKTAKGYELVAEDFGLTTEHGNITLDEMHLIETWRSLPGEVRLFLRKAIDDAQKIDV